MKKRNVITVTGLTLAVAAILAVPMQLNAKGTTSTTTASAETVAYEIGADEDTFKADGLVTNNGKTVYYDENGMPVTGWKEVDGKTYYFSEDTYYALTGKQTIDGETYYFDENGVLDPDWTEEEETTTVAAEEDTSADTAAADNSTATTAAASTTTSTTTTTTAAQTTTQTAAETVQASVPYDTANLGSVGNLSIPGLGIDVALNYVDMTSASSNPQGVVNAADSAAYMGGFAVPVIADHASQGFSALASAYGQTAYIYNGSSVTTYMCVGVYSGVNTGDDIQVNGQSMIYSAPGSLVMYTCASSDGVNVYVTVWNIA
jgi:YHS domain-containing protein